MSPATPRRGHPTDRPHPRRTLLALTLPALSYSLAQTMLVPALGDLVEELQTDVASVTWLLTGYLVAAAVFTPLVGRLGDMFGKRRLLMLSVLAFAVGNVICALGQDVSVLVVGRVVQGVAGGLFPLCFGIVRDEFPRDEVAGGVGLISATIGIGGGAGLLLGGVLVDAFGYPSIFWLGAVCSALSVVMIALLVPESPQRVQGRVDLVGAAVLSAGLVLVLVAVSQGRAWGWSSPRTLGAAAVGLVVLVLWLPLQRRTVEPLVDVRTLARPAVLLTNVATLLIGFGMFGAYVLIPQVVQAPRSTGYGFGATATHAGLLMIPGSLSMLVFGPISGVLGARCGHRVSLALGSVLSALGLAMLGAFHGSDVAIAGWFLVVCAGIGFAFAAMPNLILGAVPPDQTGQATGFNAVVRSIGSSMGTQVTAVLVVSSAAAGSLVPSGSGYTAAFAMSAAVTLLAAVVALLVPQGVLHRHVRTSEEVGAASLVPDPALAADPA
jgi:EmrB/QacA subfamily drug resistance transporter